MLLAESVAVATSWSPVWIPVTTWYFRFVLNCDQGFMWPFGTHYFLFFNFLNFLLSSSFVRRNASFSSRSACWSFCCETDCDESKLKFNWLPPKDSPLLFCCFWGVASGDVVSLRFMLQPATTWDTLVQTTKGKWRPACWDFIGWNKQKHTTTLVHTILHTAKIFGMECVIFLDAIGGTRCIPEKNGRGAKTAQQEWWGGMRCPGTLGQQGEIIFFWQKLIGVLLKLNLPKEFRNPE